MLVDDYMDCFKVIKKKFKEKIEYEEDIDH